MPIFIYTALSENGARTSGEKAASSAELLRAELVSQGLLVQSMREKRSGFGFARRACIKPEHFMLFNQELIALIRAGLTITEALKLLADRPDSPALSHILERVQDDVRRGVDFSDACAQHPDAFDGMYIATLKEKRPGAWQWCCKSSRPICASGSRYKRRYRRHWRIPYSCSLPSA